MAESEDSAAEQEAPAKRGMGLIGWGITAVLALGLGGGAFFAMHSGLVDGLLHAEETPHAEEGTETAKEHYLELDPLMISVGGANSVKQLRFRAFLQLADEAQTDVAALQPRILDIFATYLRAVSVDRLEDPTGLLHLRAQLLRRGQLLAGRDAVEDLLIIDFVIT